MVLTLALSSAVACAKPAPPADANKTAATASPAGAKRYPVSGQIMKVNSDKQSLTIKHRDIPDYMPAMTMTFKVARPELMKERVPGELVLATLEVTDDAAQLIEITRTGTEPLPTGQGVGMAASLLSPGDTVADTAFIDQKDKRRALAEWRGTPLLVTFIYTRCPLPTYCPLMDKQFAAIQKQGAADPALKGRFRLLSVSFDPEHDTAAVLDAHAKKVGADPSVWTFASADTATVDRFAAKFGVSITREGTNPGEITHTLGTALIGGDGKLVKIYSGNEWTVAAVMADLRAAAAAPAK